MPPTRCRNAREPTSIAASSQELPQRQCASSSKNWSPTPRLVTTLETRGPSSPPPPLTAQILAPVQKLSAEYFPGVPVLPILQPGATDGQFLNAVGIPTYGIEPLFAGSDLGHIHGLNEYISVQSVLDCRDFLYRLIKIYADEK